MDGAANFKSDQGVNRWLIELFMIKSFLKIGIALQNSSRHIIAYPIE